MNHSARLLQHEPMKVDESQLEVYAARALRIGSPRGFMKKKGAVATGWKSRFFALLGNLLFYYPSNNEGTKPQGVIFMEGAKITNRSCTVDGESCCFIVETASQRTYTLSTGVVGADADATRVRWLDALESPLCVALFDKPAMLAAPGSRVARVASSQALRVDPSTLIARTAASTATAAAAPPTPPAAGGAGKPSTAAAAPAPAPAPIPVSSTASTPTVAVAVGSPGGIVSESPQRTGDSLELTNLRLALRTTQEELAEALRSFEQLQAANAELRAQVEALGGQPILPPTDPGREIRSIADQPSAEPDFTRVPLTTKHIALWTGTWNVGAVNPFEGVDRSKLPSVLASFMPLGYDVYVLGVQECAGEPMMTAIEEYFAPHGIFRVSLLSKNVVAPIHRLDTFTGRPDRVEGRGDGSFINRKFTGLAVFAKGELCRTRQVYAIRCCCHSFGSTQGSKGGVGALLRIAGRTCAFVSVHLAANKPAMRRQQFGILMEALGHQLGEKSMELTDQFHHIFFMGDLNYRVVGLPAEETVRMLEEHRASELYAQNDGLVVDRLRFGVYASFKELPLFPNFFPTYKKYEHRYRVMPPTAGAEYASLRRLGKVGDSKPGAPVASVAAGRPAATAEGSAAPVDLTAALAAAANGTPSTAVVVDVSAFDDEDEDDDDGEPDDDDVPSSATGSADEDLPAPSEDSSWVQQTYRVKYKEPFYKGGRVKARVPGWCDRVLYRSLPSVLHRLKGEEVQLTYPGGTAMLPHYRSVNAGAAMDVSDHSPVSAGFVLTEEDARAPVVISSMIQISELVVSVNGDAWAMPLAARVVFPAPFEDSDNPPNAVRASPNASLREMQCTIQYTGNRYLNSLHLVVGVKRDDGIGGQCGVALSDLLGDIRLLTTARHAKVCQPLQLHGRVVQEPDGIPVSVQFLLTAAPGISE